MVKGWVSGMFKQLRSTVPQFSSPDVFLHSPEKLWEQSGLGVTFKYNLNIVRQKSYVPICSTIIIIFHCTTILYFVLNNFNLVWRHISGGNPRMKQHIWNDLILYLCFRISSFVRNLCMDLDVQYCADRKSILCERVWNKIKLFTNKKSINITMFRWCFAITGGKGIFTMLPCVSGIGRVIFPCRSGTAEPCIAFAWFTLLSEKTQFSFENFLTYDLRVVVLGKHICSW